MPPNTVLPFSINTLLVPILVAITGLLSSMPPNTVVTSVVIMESNIVFGGLKITIPPHWDIKTEVTTVFGGIEDKRPVIATKIDTSKVLILKGNTIFGGIEIRSY